MERVQAKRCPNCRRSVLAGPSSDTGLEIVADPSPLSNLGEALALMDDRATVMLRWFGNRYEIYSRDQTRIEGTPASTNGVDVLVRHECARATGPPLPTKPHISRGYVEPTPLPIDPPF